MPKRAAVPQNTFGGTPTALDKLTGRTRQHEPETEHAGEEDKQTSAEVIPQNSSTVEPQSSDTVKQQSSDTVSQQKSNTVIQQSQSTIADDSSTREKISFYLRPDQIDKLDDLTRAYKRRTGKRLNRNELVRRLIDNCTLDMLFDA